MNRRKLILKYVVYVNPDSCEKKLCPIEHDNDWKGLPRKIEYKNRKFEMLIDEELNEPFRHFFTNQQVNLLDLTGKIIPSMV